MVNKPGATKKKTVYELVGETRPAIRRGLDPLDDILLDEEQELSREVKRMRLEQIVVRRRRELEKMKQGGDMDMGTMPSNTDFLNMAKFMAELSPEEAARVRNAYSFFKLAEKGQAGGGMALLPTLLNYAKTNPGASENQMINYLKLMDGQLVKGIELAKAVNPQQNEDATLKFMTLMKDLVIEGVRNPVMQAIRESQPQQGVLDQIFTNPTLFTQFKELGLFGGGSGGATSHLDLEIEKLRGERQLEVTKLNLDMKKSMLEIDAKDRRTDNILAILSPLSALFAGPVAERMQQLGQQQAASHVPPSQVPAAGGTTILLRCTCGYEGPTTFPGAPPNLIPCPQCGQELLVGGASANGDRPNPDRKDREYIVEGEMYKQ